MELLDPYAYTGDGMEPDDDSDAEFWEWWAAGAPGEGPGDQRVELCAGLTLSPPTEVDQFHGDPKDIDYPHRRPGLDLSKGSALIASLPTDWDLVDEGRPQYASARREARARRPDGGLGPLVLDYRSLDDEVAEQHFERLAVAAAVGEQMTGVKAAHYEMHPDGGLGPGVVAMAWTESGPAGTAGVIGVVERGMDWSYVKHILHPDWQASPAGTEDFALTTVLHELGHLDHGAEGQMASVFEETAGVGKGISEYGATNPHEAYAEAFMAFHAVGGDTSRLMADERAVVARYVDMFGWKYDPALVASLGEFHGDPSAGVGEFHGDPERDGPLYPHKRRSTTAGQRFRRGIFRRWVEDSPMDFDPEDRDPDLADKWPYDALPSFPSEEARSYTKAMVGKALRDRIRSRPDYKATLDAMDVTYLRKTGEPAGWPMVMGGGAGVEPLDPVERREHFERRWKINAGIDQAATNEEVARWNDAKLVEFQERWRLILPDIKKLSLGAAWLAPGLFEDVRELERFLEEDRSYKGPGETGFTVLRAKTLAGKVQMDINELAGEGKISAMDHFVWGNSLSTEGLVDRLYIPNDMTKAYVDAPAPDMPMEDLEREFKLAVLTRHYIDQWAQSAGDHNVHSIAVQRQLHEWSKQKFGTAAGDITSLEAFASNPPGYVTVPQSPWEQATEVLNERGPFLDMFLDAQYEETQAMFREEGIKTVPLFRGMYYDEVPDWLRPFKEQASGSDEHILFGVRGTITDPTRLVLQPASSWAASRRIAKQFTTSGRVRVLISEDVPVENILGTAVSGVGALHEEEAVVIGYSFDADKIEWEVQ